MVKASALFIVIVISFLLASITSGIVYYTFYYKIQVANQQIYHKLIHNLNSAIAYVLYLPEAQTSIDKTIDLYGEENDRAQIKSKVWGVFNIASVSVSDKNITLEKSFLYGYAPDQASNAAIHLKNSDRGLRLSGKTSIVGTCYLPQGVVQAAAVDGYLYQGSSKLIEGTIIKSTDQEIAINLSIIKRSEELLSLNFTQEGSTDAEADKLFTNDSLIHSFAEPILYLNYNDPRLKEVTYLEGNIILYSSQPIHLSHTLKIKDALLVAPSLRFPENYQGSLQVVCSDSIVVESNVKLEYPSALLLIKKNIANANPMIQVKKGARINGVIFAYSNALNDDKVYVQLQSGSYTMGQVYSTGSIDCQGTVHGGLMCKTILLKTNTSINENYLLNTTIDVTKRSVYYTGSNLLPAKNKKRIIKYL
jgi:hypothetical protein